jgi:hypothetical protein
VSSRTWQVVAAVVSIAVMVVVIVRYVTRDEPPPPTLPATAAAQGPAADPVGTSPLGGTPGSGATKEAQPHAGMEHHTAEKPVHEGGQVAPLQVFANAHVGDWLAYRVTTESSLAPTFHATGIETITKVDDKTVARAFSGKVEETGEIKRQSYEARPRDGLTLDQLTTNDVGGWTIYEVAVSDDVHEVGGRKFKCKKISYASNDPLIAGKRTHTDLWISTEVPAGGLVEEHEVQDMPDMHFRITKQVIGFGDAKSTAWGTKPAGL